MEPKLSFSLIDRIFVAEFHLTCGANPLSVSTMGQKEKRN